MAHFLLVHGAWHGAWCWQKILPALIKKNHRVHAVTLTGVGERAHLLSPSIHLETHITDVENAMISEELESVILVVHSYAGMLGTAIADRHAQRIQHLVYVDAVLPKPGESWGSTHASATREARLNACRAHSSYSFPPPDPAALGLKGEDAEWVKRRMTAHPGHPYTDTLDFDPQKVASIPRTYLNCTSPKLATVEVSRVRIRDPLFWDGAWQKNAQTIDLESGHNPMMSDHETLSNILLSLAE